MFGLVDDAAGKQSPCAWRMWNIVTGLSESTISALVFKFTVHLYCLESGFFKDNTAKIYTLTQIQSERERNADKEDRKWPLEE